MSWINLSSGRCPANAELAQSRPGPYPLPPPVGAIVQTIWAYLIRLTASRAGIAQADAERQVDEAIIGATSLQLGGGRTAHSQVSRATRLT